MAKYNKQQLLLKLPTLPAATKKKLVDSVIHGLMVGVRSNPHVLLDLDASRGPWLQKFVPDPKVDLMTKNASRRKVLSLNPTHTGFMSSLNLALKGGEDYPLLTGLLGITTGLLSGGAGLLFSLVTIGVSASKVSQPIRARLGDEIWQVEILGKEGQKIMHLEYFVLVDPLRAKVPNLASEWVIHEDRKEVEVG